MNILIYSPSNLRAADQQAQAELFLSLGHKVYLLTWAEQGVLHTTFEALGAQAFSSSHVKGKSLIFFMKQAAYLIKFCRQKNIDIVFAHLQSNAMVAGLARLFLKTRFVYIRHNADYVSLQASRKTKSVNWLANRLSNNIIAISDNVKKELINEGVSKARIHRINLCYNFNQYEAERKHNANELRATFNADFLLIYVARLDPLKRHLKSFFVVETLRKEGYDCKLVCIGQGEYHPKLEKWISDHGMKDSVFLEGFVTNVLDYIEAADVLLHLSYSEASSHAIKEAGLCNRTVIVCKEVGDFEEYLVDGVNGFLVDKENPEEQTAERIKQLLKNRAMVKEMGLQLHHTIVNTFGIENAKNDYLKLLNQLNK